MPTTLSDTEILDLLSVDDFVSSCDQAFRLYGSGEMKNASRVESLEQSEGEDTFRLELSGAWAGVVEGRKVIVEKSDVQSGKLGDRSAAIELTLSSGESYVLDAEGITNRRTGAAAALGARYMAPKDVSTVAIVGTGRIAESAALAIDHTLEPEFLFVTSRSSEKRQQFAISLAPQLRATLRMMSTVDEAVSEADVVVLAVPTPNPILSSKMIRPGAHVSVIGGDPRTVQLEVDLLIERPVIVDDLGQAKVSGDFIRYQDQIGEFNLIEEAGRPATIGDAALGRLEAHRGSGCLTYFTGMAVQDLHAAYSAVLALP